MYKHYKRRLFQAKLTFIFPLHFFAVYVFSAEKSVVVCLETNEPDF